MQSTDHKTKIFLDTNVLMDLVFGRESGCKEAKTIFWLGEQGEVELQIALLSFVNTVYVAKRYGVAVNEIRNAFSIMMDFVEVPDCGKAELMHALRSPMKDFEDSTQVAAALTGLAEVIVTRNTKDFEDCPIKVLTPIEFLEEYSYLLE